MGTIPCLHRKRRWTVKRSISAAVVVTLVLIAVTATISISLAPSNISFQIRQAEIVGYPKDPLNKTHNRIVTTHLNFTLVALNNSSRTEVRYDTVDAEIWYGPTDGAWIRTTAFVLRSDIDAGKWYPPGSNACFGASADYGYSLYENVPNNSLVVVETKVWFRYGLATTLPFTVRSSCWHVNFVNKTNVPIACA